MIGSLPLGRGISEENVWEEKKCTVHFYPRSVRLLHAILVIIVDLGYLETQTIYSDGVSFASENKTADYVNVLYAFDF